MSFVVWVVIGFSVGLVVGGLIYVVRHEIRVQKSQRAPNPLDVARAAGREDVLNGWVRWARNSGHETTYVSWDQLPLDRKLGVLKRAKRRADDFNAAEVMGSEEWRLHQDPDVRNAYLDGASAAGEEITEMCLNMYAGQEESARQGRRITADVRAVRELDPEANRLRWDRDYGG